MARGLGRRSGRHRRRTPEPLPRRSGDRRCSSARRAAPGRRRPCPGFSIGNGRLAWATPPGQDGEGSRVQIVAWARRRRRHHRERPGRGRHRRSLTRDSTERMTGLTTRDDGVHATGVVVSVQLYRATQQVGRRVGAHRRPRPGRATGSRRFTGPQPGGTRPGRRIPAALRSPRTTSRSTIIDRPLDDALRVRGRRRPTRRTFIEPGEAPETGPTQHGRRSNQPEPDSATSAQAAEVHAAPATPRSTTTGRRRCGCRAARSSIICGDGGCIERVVNDYGPQKPSRIVDLYRPDFFKICGCPSWCGVVDVTVYVY